MTRIQAAFSRLAPIARSGGPLPPLSALFFEFAPHAARKTIAVWRKDLAMARAHGRPER